MLHSLANFANNLGNRILAAAAEKPHFVVLRRQNGRFFVTGSYQLGVDEAIGRKWGIPPAEAENLLEMYGVRPTWSDDTYPSLEQALASRTKLQEQLDKYDSGTKLSDLIYFVDTNTTVDDEGHWLVYKIQAIR